MPTLETGPAPRCWERETGSREPLDPEIPVQLVDHRLFTATPATTANVDVWSQDFLSSGAAVPRNESVLYERAPGLSQADRPLWDVADTVVIGRLAVPQDELSVCSLQSALFVQMAAAREDERFERPSPVAEQLARAVAVAALSVGHEPLDGGWCDEGLAIEFAEGTRRVTVECLNDGAVAVLLRNSELGRWQTIEFDPGPAAADQASSAAVGYLDRSRPQRAS